MLQQAIDFHVNPSEETVRLGPLAVRFLITGENSNGSVAAFEVGVPAGQRLAAPTHSHDHYEETIYGIDGVLISHMYAFQRFIRLAKTRERFQLERRKQAGK